MNKGRRNELTQLKFKKRLKQWNVKDKEKEHFDNGSYYADQCHAFRAWKKQQSK